VFLRYLSTPDDRHFHAEDVEARLILLDLTLPGMSGTEALSVLPLVAPHVKIILFTMHADGVNQSLASIFRLDRVISKADSISTLGEHIKALLTPVNGPQRRGDVTEANTARASKVAGKPRTVRRPLRRQGNSNLI
jgi:DNA-binding NarL/FixJ family response regulator